MNDVLSMLVNCYYRKDYETCFDMIAHITTPSVGINSFAASVYERVQLGCCAIRNESFHGLSIKFLSMGAINYVGSSWPIDDQTSSEIAIRFYSDIIAGVTVGEALLNAKRKRPPSDDSTWVSLVLFGCPRNGVFGEGM